MKTIPLTRGMVAIVDDADYEFVNQWKWCAHCCTGLFYAARNVRVNGKLRTLHMHRLLSGAASGQQVDHADRCTLNNQRANLRICDSSNNHANSGKSKNKSSRFKGVCWIKDKKKWRATIKLNHKTTFLGYFDSPEDAARAYDEAAQKTFGDFSLTNKRLNLFPATQ